MSGRDIALDLYNSFKNGKKSFPKKNNVDVNNTDRETIEPKTVGELIDELIKTRDWQGGLSEGEIFVKWSELVGAEIASHSELIEIKSEKLLIQCDSSAWATQLNLVKNQLLEKIQQLAPGVKTLEIIGPNAPSWRRGLRTIQGSRGPRDTYG
mgnify:CR=1 FL=1